MRPLIVTGNGTGVGKTIVASIFTLVTEGNYWKPVQSGDLDQSDTFRAKQLTGLPQSRFLPEAYRLTQPLSPHASARRDGIEISKDQLKLPESSRPLVIEGAGGPLVPLSLDLLFIDLFVQWQGEVIIVSQHYLGSINHTLATVEALRSRGLSLRGLVFNGDPNPDTEEALCAFTGLPVVGRLRVEADWNPQIIRSYAEEWNVQEAVL